MYLSLVLIFSDLELCFMDGTVSVPPVEGGVTKRIIFYHIYILLQRPILESVLMCYLPRSPISSDILNC